MPKSSQRLCVYVCLDLCVCVFGNWENVVSTHTMGFCLKLLLFIILDNGGLMKPRKIWCFGSTITRRWCLTQPIIVTQPFFVLSHVRQIRAKFINTLLLRTFHLFEFFHNKNVFRSFMNAVICTLSCCHMKQKICNFKKSIDFTPLFIPTNTQVWVNCCETIHSSLFGIQKKRKSSHRLGLCWHHMQRQNAHEHSTVKCLTFQDLNGNKL